MDKLSRYCLLAGSVFAQGAFAQQDSLIVRDSITVVVSDTAVFVNDSAIAQIDSFPEVADSAAADIPEKLFYTISVPEQNSDWDQGGYVPEIVFTDIYPRTLMWCWSVPHEPPYNSWNPFDQMLPPLVKLTVFDSLGEKDSNGIYFEDVHPNNLSANDPNEKPEGPGPPVLPEEPWYQAILPSVLRLKKKA